MKGGNVDVLGVISADALDVGHFKMKHVHF